MAMLMCFSFLTGRKKKSKGNEQASEKDFQTLLLKLKQHPRISSETRDLKPTTFEVTVPYGIQRNSRSKVRVMNLGSPMNAEVQEAYEGEAEKEDSPSIKREHSELDLQGHEAVASERYDPTDREVKHPVLYGNQANNQLEDKSNKYSEKSVDILQSGHVSDPGIDKAEFWASPKFKLSSSNMERRDVLRKITHHLPPSKSHSLEDLQEFSANQMVNLESPRSVMSHRSADRVLLRRHSSSQFLYSGSKRLWWKLFLWNPRIIHRTFSSRSAQLVPANAALNSQCGYSSDTIETKQEKALRHEESSDSIVVESFNNGKNIDNQRWSEFHNGNNGFSPRNQYVAFSSEPSSFTRVDAWLKNLEIQQPPPEDDFDDDNVTSIVFPPSPDAGRSMARNTSPLTQHTDANLSKNILNANSVVQSLNPASVVAHLTGIGIITIPAMSHLSNLCSINLSCNSIVQILPGFLPKGTQTLNLSRNNIKTFDGLRELTRLRVLDLGYNRISRIGQGLSNCTLIKVLYLAGNKISNVEGLHRLLKLTFLDLSFNRIATTKAIGHLVANYNSLQALNLLRNPIQSNISDNQLRKAVCGLLPNLVFMNEQPINPQRAREIFIAGVSKAALGNNIRSKSRRSLKKVGQGGSSYTNGHRRASVAQKSRSSSRSRNQRS